MALSLGRVLRAGVFCTSSYGYIFRKAARAARATACAGVDKQSRRYISGSRILSFQSKREVIPPRGLLVRKRRKKERHPI